ncbi:MAG TPA: ribbon-helix-helix protein, CopG family [Steroidobacteraceae bacterium]
MIFVPNLLIRGLSDAAVERIDAEAAALGLSRNEFLRRRLERDAAAPVAATVSVDDWNRSAAAFGDLADPRVMDAAWR